MFTMLLHEMCQTLDAQSYLSSLFVGRVLARAALKRKPVFKHTPYDFSICLLIKLCHYTHKVELFNHC